MFNCDKCKTVMVLDYKHSTDFYNSNVTTILNEDGNIDFNSLPDEVVYACRNCGTVQVIELSAIILAIKKRIIKAVLDIRYGAVYHNFDNSAVEEANGVAFCGICSGVADDSGYCYNDVIKECPVRKILNDKEHLTERDKYRE